MTEAGRSFSEAASEEVARQKRMHTPLIGFEGPIGAGKTTLAKLLASRAGYRLFLERFDENEFLADFYTNKSRWALPMQLWFLAERHKQLEIVSAELEAPAVIDYTPLKNEVFASLLLDGRELRLYESLAGSLWRAVRQLDLVVYLDADNQVLLERVRARARAYEAHIDATYLNSLRSAYLRYLQNRSDIPIFRFNTSKLDLGSFEQMNNFYDSVLQRARLVRGRLG